jgi:hypothetical protein
LGVRGLIFITCWLIKTSNGFLDTPTLEPAFDEVFAGLLGLIETLLNRFLEVSVAHGGAPVEHCFNLEPGFTGPLSVPTFASITLNCDVIPNLIRPRETDTAGLLAIGSRRDLSDQRVTTSSCILGQP